MTACQRRRGGHEGKRSHACLRDRCAEHDGTRNVPRDETKRDEVSISVFHPFGPG